PLPGGAARGERHVPDQGGAFADALDQAGGQPGAVGHVEELVLHRRRAGVEDEHPGRGGRVRRAGRDGGGGRRAGRAHGWDAFAVSEGDWAWIAVMATGLDRKSVV